MLSDENMSGRINCKSLGVPDAGGITFGRREDLLGAIGAVFPDPPACFQFRAGASSGNPRLTVLRLAGVCGGGNVYVQGPIVGDEERVHRMIAAQRQTGDDGLGGTSRNNAARRQCVSHDAIVDLGVDGAIVQADARAARTSGGDRFAEALHDISLAGTSLVLQGDQKSVGARLVRAIVGSRPCIDVDHSAGAHHHVTSVTDTVGKNRRTKAGGEFQSGVVTRAGGRFVVVLGR